MNKSIHYLFFSFLLFISVGGYAQTEKQFNGSVEIFGINFAGAGIFRVTGLFSDPSGAFSGNQLLVGDNLVDKKGDLYVVKTINAAGLMLDITIEDLRAPLKQVAPLIGSGIIFRPTTNGYPLLSAGASPMVLSAVNNTAIIKIDQDIYKTKAGSGGIFTIDPNVGDVFLLTSDGKFYIYDGSSWVTITNSDEQTLTDVLSKGTDAGGMVISNLSAPVADQDAATKKYVDTKTAGVPNGGSLPDPTLAKAGDIFYNTGEKRFYVFDGTSWTPVADNQLAQGQFYVGDAAGKAAQTPKSAIPLSGFGAAASPVSLGGQVLINLGDPVDNQDAATKKYVDTKTSGVPNGSALPDPALSKIGDTFYNTNEKRLYIFDGTNWSLVSDNLLAQDHFLVGDAFGKAMPIAKIAIPLSGFGLPTAALQLNNQTIIDLADPSGDQDAATKKYVDVKTAGVASGSSLPDPSLAKVGDTFYHTLEKHLFVFDGIKWVPILENQLGEGQIFVGDASGKALATTKSTIPISGFGLPISALSFNNQAITDLADPSGDQDAATKKYVDLKTSGVPSGSTLPEPSLAKAGDTFYNTAEKRFYVFDGTQWSPISDNQLAEGQFFIGDATGKASAIAKNSIPLSGFGLPTNAISLNNQGIINLADPLADQDAATKKYVDLSLSTAKDNLGNHTAIQNLVLGNYSLSNDGALGKGISFDPVGNASLGQDLTVNGNFYTPSDRRLKTDIQTLKDALGSIGKLRGVKFKYKDQKVFVSGSKVGVIAQELQKVFPEMVVIGRDGFLKVDYTQLIAVLIQAIKEQQYQIEQQNLQVDKLSRDFDKQQDQINFLLRTIGKN